MFIACDEAGHTGPDLISEDQRYFAFASVNIPEVEAYQIIHDARAAFPVQMPELKASKLMASQNGRRLVGYILESIKGRFAVNAHDKLLALCGWLFEYIFEPVYQDDPKVFYENDFHLFIAMFTYMWLVDENAAAADAIAQFQRYMRTKDIGQAPILFEFEDIGEGEDFHPFDLVRSFATGHQELIQADNDSIKRLTPESGKWTLDLSASAFWSHLNHWGKSQRSLTVICDESKPLRAIVPSMTGDSKEAGIQRAKSLFDAADLGWELKQPVLFDDSRAHPSIQLADIVASSAVFCFTKGMPEGFGSAASILDSAMLKDSIFPDYDRVDIENVKTKVNYAVLYQLARQAHGHGLNIPVEHSFALAESGIGGEG